MNIWDWIDHLQRGLTEAGQAHNAELIDKLSTAVCDMESERADALLPEVRALCKTIDNPWLEVYVGHWEMRNRLGNRSEGETALPDIVRLFEYAHRPNTSDCPQSICVTQDMSACLANIDGPGLSQERIDVCDETLARITPKWACFECISSEKAEAIMDDGRIEDALTYTLGQIDRIQKEGQGNADALSSTLTSIYLALHRYEDALAQIDLEEASNQFGGREPRNTLQGRAIRRARALAGLQRDDEAWDHLPALTDMPLGNYLTWLRSAYPLLQRRPEENTWQLARELQRGLEHYDQYGAHRYLITMAELCIRLAIQRGAAWTARRQWQLADKHLGQLRQDRGAQALLAELDRDIQAMPSTGHMPVPADQLLSWLGEPDRPRNPELEVEWLLTARQELPEDAPLRDQCVEALRACGATPEAMQLLWEHLEQHHDQEETAAYHLLSLLLDQPHDIARSGIDRLVNLFSTSAPTVAHWCQAQWAVKTNDWPKVEQHTQAIVALQPDLVGAQHLLAHALLRQQRFSDAAAVHESLMQAHPDQTNHVWDYLTAACAARDWDGVRRGAEKLSISLSSTEGPIEEDWGWIIIRYIEDDKAMDYYARRLGPVHAIIAESSIEQRPQHLGDMVVFDAQPLFPPPDNEEDQASFVRTFRFIHTLEDGGFGRGWLVDGADPGEERMDQLRQQIQELGWKLWVHSGNDYTVTDTIGSTSISAPEGTPAEQTLPGIYFTVTAPRDVAAATVDQWLTQVTQDWPHAMCWMRLAEHAGAPVDRHQEVIERYRL